MLKIRSKMVRASLTQSKSSLWCNDVPSRVAYVSKSNEIIARDIAANFPVQMSLEIPSVICTLIREGNESSCFHANCWQRLSELKNYELAKDGRSAWTSFHKGQLRGQLEGFDALGDWKQEATKSNVFWSTSKFCLKMALRE